MPFHVGFDPWKWVKKSVCELQGIANISFFIIIILHYSPLRMAFNISWNSCTQKWLHASMTTHKGSFLSDCKLGQDSHALWDTTIEWMAINLVFWKPKGVKWGRAIPSCKSTHREHWNEDGGHTTSNGRLRIALACGSPRCGTSDSKTERRKECARCIHYIPMHHDQPWWWWWFSKCICIKRTAR